MSFVSIEFALLLAALLILFALIRTASLRKLILLSVSCFFYAYWDWRFLGLLAFVTVLDYYVSRLLIQARSPRVRSLLLAMSVTANLGLLIFFKYCNFFIDSLNVLLPFGWKLNGLAIILPIGISFYIFETLSYVIDVYRGVTRPARSLIDYAIFITFFPRLVSGPIMRAQQFLPQLEQGIRLSRENLAAGAQIFLRGLVKKLVIADNMAQLVDPVFSAPDLYSSQTVWLAVFAYSLQILCDFSGYTDMALGIGRMLGFKLPENFNLPYTAQSFTEFWQRWHISLSSWLRDYLYIPLGGNRHGQLRTYLNLMLTMLLGGLWHGASWNFVVWGGLHGLYLAIERYFTKGKSLPAAWTSPIAWLRASMTFIITSWTWIFFRSPSWKTTTAVLKKMSFVHPSGFIWEYPPAIAVIPAIVLGGFLFRRFEMTLPILPTNKGYTMACMIIAALVVYFLAPLNTSPFIYFQF